MAGDSKAIGSTYAVYTMRDFISPRKRFAHLRTPAQVSKFCLRQSQHRILLLAIARGSLDVFPQQVLNGQQNANATTKPTKLRIQTVQNIGRRGTTRHAFLLQLALGCVFNASTSSEEDT